VNEEKKIAHLEERLAETRARRLMAERDVAALTRQAGLARSARKLERNRLRAEDQLSKLRLQEAELEQKIEQLKNPVTQAEEVAESNSESTQQENG
jgi:phage shock protein A